MGTAVARSEESARMQTPTAGNYAPTGWKTTPTGEIAMPTAGNFAPTAAY
ncbi:MAG: hypothetical protein GY822_12210 [Deltaproteobacteria bacterium]|nr:hypothetical protein [Deltaproteobacteria bacterium]